jgi:hypothetical protein
MFKVQFKTSGAAFEEPGDGNEIARILIAVAETINGHTGHANGAVRDINGNTIGSWSYTLD